MRSFVAILLVSLAGCADYATASEDRDTGADSTNAPTETGLDSDDEAPPEAPQYWTLDGTLVVSGGVLDLDASTFVIDLWLDGASVCDALADTGGTDEDGAPTEPVIGFAETSAPPSELGTYAWWDLTLAEGSSPCVAPLPVTAVGLGLGPMDSRLYPALEHDGSADPAASGSTLYAAYLKVGDADPWVFGVAGTEGNFAGSEAAVTEAPLPDGTYTLRSLFLLPVP